MVKKIKTRFPQKKWCFWRKFSNKSKKAIDNETDKNKTVFSIKKQKRLFISIINSRSPSENFKSNLEYMRDKKCIIVIDFKENIEFRGGPILIKAIFSQKISVLGIAVIYK